MLVYHGSDHIIKKPQYNGSKRNNDYGYGFYTTEDIELAKEWACADGKDGYVNLYELDMNALKVLNLNSSDYSILNWLAILTKFRSYWQKGLISEDAKVYLQNNFYVDLTPYDVIVGYRADDSYFTFAQDFVAGTISLKKLSEAMHLGKLGEQIVLKSQKAFEHISFLGVEDVCGESAAAYYEKKVIRDREARKAYRMTRSSQDDINAIRIIDIMREGMTNGDPRLL